MTPFDRSAATRRSTGRPTMSDVATVAGVSLKTVSRVVNREGTVQEATTARVRAAVATLGFRRNDAASTLARASAQALIGVVIEDVSDPFYSRLAGGIEQVARDHGHLILLASSQENSGLERSATLALADRGVAGMIIVPHSKDHRYLEPEIRSGLHIVFVDRPPRLISADAVLSDNVDGARQGVAHLIDLGHTRIAFVGNDSSVYTSSRRLRGYRLAHADAALTVDEQLVVRGPNTVEQAKDATLALLESSEPPTALFTQNNLVTMGAWRAARLSGASIDLVGYDDFAMADVLDPPVTVVAQDPLALGREAATLLFARLAGLTDPARRVIVPTRLIVRSRH